MYGLKIADGDIAVRGDGDVTQVSGGERLSQEMSCWLLEPLGADPMYPKFGSDLATHVGKPMTADEMSSVSGEVARVAGNYVAYQQTLIANTTGTASQVADVWKDDDVVRSVSSIGVSSVTDTCSVRITLETGGGAQLTVAETV